MKLRIKKVTNKDLQPPSYAHDGDAGLDLRACTTGPVAGYSLLPGQRETISTGYAFEIPYGYEGQVRGRSGLTKRGLWVATGTVDSGYRGVIAVHVMNVSREEIHINHGDRIAQLIIAPVARATIEVVDELSETERGDGGFGSTGVR